MLKVKEARGTSEDNIKNRKNAHSIFTSVLLKVGSQIVLLNLKQNSFKMPTDFGKWALDVERVKSSFCLIKQSRSLTT